MPDLTEIFLADVFMHALYENYQFVYRLVLRSFLSALSLLARYLVQSFQEIWVYHECQPTE